MKIIFLDIDGVLVTSRHMVQSKKYFGHEFDPECVRNLQEILEKTEAKIVVSSSWREGRILKQLQSIFEINGIKKVVGMTPIIEGAIRGKEIKEYLNDILNSGVEVDKFVIIDDEEEMGELDDHLVETSFETGITKAIADKVIHFLV
ncbi:HAD domain-containing protein [Paenibacillus elgii]|uniref:HAD domain-containing protein n=1 Tax=Paenibacillus elgii TaxID=189691 RepID=UPI002040FAA5|nr:HAD domain-containing protein [Paenibacillus elgii]MCM3268818.1 HAD domain-containing protein [Paenibacillus elgii]